MSAEFFCPADMQLAHKEMGAMCGHGAFAACLRIPVVVVCLHWPGGVGAGWVNMPAMERALHDERVSYQIVGRRLPKDGLAILQWEGPWTRPGVPARVACMHRHWIAVRGGYVWDAEFEAWLPMKEWESLTNENLPEKATGWSVARGYEVKGSNR